MRGLMTPHRWVVVAKSHGRECEACGMRTDWEGAKAHCQGYLAARLDSSASQKAARARRRARQRAT